MYKTIRWPQNDQIVFHGRNGTGKCTGVELTVLTSQSAENDRVNLQPITSRGMAGNCHIEVPIASVPAVVEALLELHRQYRRESQGAALTKARRRGS